MKSYIRIETDPSGYAYYYSSVFSHLVLLMNTDAVWTQEEFLLYWDAKAVERKARDAEIFSWFLLDKRFKRNRELMQMARVHFKDAIEHHRLNTE